MTRILFATTEVHPLIKTGGLADVSASLPIALRSLGNDVRIILPAYSQVLSTCGRCRRLARVDVPGVPEPVNILQGQLPDSEIGVYLVDAPQYFRRLGQPYTDAHGMDWPDNAARFAAFSRTIACAGQDRAGLAWKPDVVHCNDWQTALAPALLALEEERPITVFTVHNLAYQGLFSRSIFEELDLPQEWWSMHALEFYGRFSFIKGGLAFSDWVTTVSPTYAREIRTPEFGCGLDGLLRARGERLIGILNGADYDQWNPRTDGLLARSYDIDGLTGKLANKTALQRELQLAESPDTPLLAYIGRLVEQKGIDLIIDLMPRLLEQKIQIVILGSGEARFEMTLRAAAAKYGRQIGIHIGFDEELAHRIEAAADAIVLPSRFEPCGLNQIYSLRYGTIPIARRTGGLADTVTDAVPRTQANRSATGFLFDYPTSESLFLGIARALECYRHTPAAWKALMVTGMEQDFGWTFSATEYQGLYGRVTHAVEQQLDRESAICAQRKGVHKLDR